jgi:hypothetical protein
MLSRWKSGGGVLGVRGKFFCGVLVVVKGVCVLFSWFIEV